MDTTLYRRNVLAGLGALNFDPTGRLQVDALTASTADLTIIENLQIQSNALLTSQLNELIQIAANTSGGGGGGGSVSVNNFPSTFAATQSGTWSTGRTWTLSSLADSITASVSGSVSVSNFPATQPVSGSVSVSGTATTTDSGTPITGQSLPSGSGLTGWLSNIFNVLGTTTQGNPSAGTGILGWVVSITQYLGGLWGSLDGNGYIQVNLQTASAPVSVNSLPAGTNNIGNVNSDATGSGSVTTSAPLVVTTTNNGTLAFQSNNAATGTITIEGSVDGTTWTATTYVALASGNSSSSFNAATATIGQINTSALKAVRFRSNTIVGVVGITYNLSRNVSNIMLDNQLPAGTNTIGAVVANPPTGSITMSNSSVGTSSATLLAASSATKMLVIQNTSSNILYISTTSPATATNGIVLSANQGYEFPAIPSNALYCLGSAASTTYTLWYL